MPEPTKLDALQALKLARETGVKVRPKRASNWYSFDWKGLVLHPHNYNVSSVSLHDLIGEGSSPIEWEVV